jgi:predicted YcjX-like family ATPase
MKNSIEKLVRQRLHVTPKVGYDFSGVLLHADRSRDGQYVFAHVTVYPPEAVPEKLEGEVFFDRANVHFVQKLPPHADE